ncbi:ABC transporter permease [Winogradskya consettensis]|uniref:ABC transporter permease n=1 Tax=Winogradskya consettensis TaxID=113560 RepID=A0A919SH68_9ACTN|nr:FtsX-like permease family protein [Actinoplanes consettensis]GIM71569.1 ABC transporter permease [Actinoplanes consettensis]
MSARLRLFVSDARHSPGRVLGVAITCLVTAVVVGVAALLFTTLAGWEQPERAGLGSVSAVVVATTPDDQVAGALPADALARVRAVSGAQQAVEYRDRTVSIVRGDALLPDVDGRTTRAWNFSAAVADGYQLDRGAAPAGNELVVDGATAAEAGIDVGASVPTVSAAGVVSRRVSGILRASEGTAAGGPVLLLADPELATMAGSTLPHAILVPGAAGQDAAELRAALGAGLPGLRVLAPEDYRTGDTGVTENKIGGGINLLSLLLFALITSAATVLGTTMSLWTSQRTPQLTVLRALGVSSGRLRRMVLGDAALIAVPVALLGALLGALPGAKLARAALVDADILPTDTPAVSLGGAAVGALALAVLLTVSLTLVASLSGARQAGRLDAAAALNSGSGAVKLRRRFSRLLIGLILLALGAAPMLVNGGGGALVMGAAATVSVLILVPALTVLSPWLTPLLTPLAGLVARLDRGVGHLIASNLRMSTLRTAGLAGPALLAVGLSTALLSAPRTLDAGVVEQTTQRVQAGHLVVPAGSAGLPLALPAGYTGTAARLLDTTIQPAAETSQGGPTGIAAAGADGAALAGLLDLGSAAGGLTALTGDTFAASKDIAKQHKWDIGEQVPLLLDDGTRHDLRLVTTYGNDLGFAGVLLPMELAVAHSPDPMLAMILLGGDPAAWPATPGAAVIDRDTYLDALDPRESADSLAPLIIALVLAGYAVLSLANSAGLAQADRGPENRTLRLLGGRKDQLLRLVAGEALAAAAIGIVLGLLVGIGGLLPLARATGRALPVLDVMGVVIIPLICGLAAVIPAVLAARPLRPVTERAEGGTP